MIPPRGFKAELYPLRHKFYHAFGLSAVDEDSNTMMITLIKHYKSTNAATTVDVNPHHASFDKETGAICTSMSIIDRLRFNLTFVLQGKGVTTNDVEALRIWWQPIFFSFGEKFDAADDFTTTTVGTLLGLVKDATEEDITPLFNNTKLIATPGTSDRLHPMSTVNLTETSGINNMDTSTASESVTYNDELVKDALQHYTNKGALRSMLGRRRYLTLSSNRWHKSFYVDQPVPRAVRRIQPYTFMAILVHLPIQATDDQLYQAQALTTDQVYIGVTCKVNYHEWNADHNQDTTG